MEARSGIDPLRGKRIALMEMDDWKIPQPQHGRKAKEYDEL